MTIGGTNHAFMCDPYDISMRLRHNKAAEKAVVLEKLMPGSFFMFLVSALTVQRAIRVQEPRTRYVQEPGVELIGTDAAMSAGCGSARIGKRFSFHSHAT